MVCARIRGAYLRTVTPAPGVWRTDAGRLIGFRALELSVQCPVACPTAYNPCAGACLSIPRLTQNTQTGFLRLGGYSKDQ